MTKDIACPSGLAPVDFGDHASIITDGQALVLFTLYVSIFWVSACCDLSDECTTTILHVGAQCGRTDSALDIYYNNSVKTRTLTNSTKESKTNSLCPESHNVPLPLEETNFQALTENMANLAQFLSEDVVREEYDKTITVADDFIIEEQVEATTPDVDTSMFSVKHEEDDTRIIVHCIRFSSSNVVFRALDTDILVYW